MIARFHNMYTHIFSARAPQKYAIKARLARGQISNKRGFFNIYQVVIKVGKVVATP